MGHLRALVAEDEPDMLAMVSNALRNFGADVVEVSSGGELLEKLANDDAFDLIVTDITMPWMTGMQVMHSARTAGLPVPVVVMTASRDPTLPEQVTSLGAHAELIHKPFSVAELYAALRRSLPEAARAATAPIPKSTTH